MVAASASDLLRQAVLAAPRRYLLPDLPADAVAACALGAEAALAWAIEQARVARSPDVRASPLARARAAPATAEARAVFLRALAALVRRAMAGEGGLADVQAAVLRAHDPAVDAWQRLCDQAAADGRAVRRAVDAVAHPGKTRRLPAGPQRARLERLHRLAHEEAWARLLSELPDQPALQRLARADALRALPAVQRYRALRARHAPPAGSDAAAGVGRAAGEAGAQAERAVVAAFEAMARRLDGLDARSAAAHRHCVIQGLLPPRDLPGSSAQAKDEWDVALLRRDDDGHTHELLLLAEVKASPAAAATDLPRLLRGLRRLAGAAADRAWTFRSAQGEVAIDGASLQRLHVPGGALPPHVIYACTAEPEPHPLWLGAAARALLLAEPASLAFAHQVALGHEPPDEALAPAWAALRSAPRLRGVLHQRPTAQAARAAMLHPDDLLAALEALLPPRARDALSTPRS